MKLEGTVCLPSTQFPFISLQLSKCLHHRGQGHRATARGRPTEAPRPPEAQRSRPSEGSYLMQRRPPQVQCPSYSANSRIVRSITRSMCIPTSGSSVAAHLKCNTIRLPGGKEWGAVHGLHIVPESIILNKASCSQWPESLFSFRDTLSGGNGMDCARPVSRCRDMLIGRVIPSNHGDPLPRRLSQLLPSEHTLLPDV